MPNSIPLADTVLLTKKEAARELRLSERSVHSLLKSGDLPTIRLGGSVRISRSDLLQFIARRREGTVSAA
jgi:excisionase family DNA binding protein